MNVDVRFDEDWKLIDGNPCVFRRRYVAPSPVGVAYIALEDSLAARLPMPLCQYEDCGRPIVAKHKNARYCKKCQSRISSKKKRGAIAVD